MAHLITDYRNGFSWGVTEITTLNDATGIAFSITKLKKGEKYSITTQNEFAFLLLEGKLEITIDNNKIKTGRTSLFDDLPTSVHVPAKTLFSLTALTDIEFATFQIENSASFEPKIYIHTPSETHSENFVAEALLSFVRSLFEGFIKDPNALLDFGEVVNHPNRFSNYPTHTKTYPELYHYRFHDPKGYADAKLGDNQFKVQAFDTLQIIDEEKQTTLSAPGFEMYYLWVMRHLSDNTLTNPIFTKQMQWTLESSSKGFEPA